MTNEQFLEKFSGEFLELNGYFDNVIYYSNGNIKVCGKPKGNYLYKGEFVRDLFKKLDNIEIDYLPF